MQVLLLVSNYHFIKKRSPFKTLSIRIPQLNKEKNVKKREGSEDFGKIRKRGNQGKGEGKASSTSENDLRRQLEDCQRKLQESEFQQEAQRKEKEKLIQERDMWKSKALAQGNKRALEKSSATGVSDSMMGGKKQRNK